MSPDAYELTLGDAFSSQFGPVRENGSGLDTEGEVARSQFHFLWPNTMVNIFPGRTNLSIGPVLPAGPERTERFLDYFFGPEVEQGWIGELLEFDGQVGAEDKVLVENVQRGVATGLITAFVAIGVAQLVAGFTGPQFAPVVAVGGAAIDNTPPPVKNFAISAFGSNDKRVLVAGWLAALPVPLMLIWAPSWSWVLFANVWLGPGKIELSIDLMRSRPTAPHNTMDDGVRGTRRLSVPGTLFPTKTRLACASTTT